jgi:hypothetical protein
MTDDDIDAIETAATKAESDTGPASSDMLLTDAEYAFHTMMDPTTALRLVAEIRRLRAIHKGDGNG